MANHMIERHVQKVRHLDHPVEPLVDLTAFIDLSGRHKSTPFKCSRFVHVSGEVTPRSTAGMSQFKFSWGKVLG